MIRKNIYGTGAPCPRCGSNASSHIKKGRDDSDRYPLRLRRCRDCDERFTTAETTVGDSRVFWELDYISRDRWIADWRRSNPIAIRQPRAKKRLGKIWLSVKVKEAA